MSAVAEIVQWTISGANGRSPGCLGPRERPERMRRAGRFRIQHLSAEGGSRRADITGIPLRKNPAMLAAGSFRENHMLRLAMIVFSMAAPTLMGTGVVVALASGYDTLVPILAGAGIGLVAALPASWLIAQRLQGQR